MRAHIALTVALVLLIVATASSATASETSRPASYAAPLAPLTLSLVTGNAEQAARGAITGPGTPASSRPGILEDPGSPSVPVAARRTQPSAQRVVVAKPKPRPRAVTGRASSTGHSLRGAASWYCNSNGSRGPISACHSQYPDTRGFDAYAAAGPRLRAAMNGNWRGRVVLVDGLRVKLVDWCQCYKGRSYEKVIDLYRDVYGVVGGSVTIRW